MCMVIELLLLHLNALQMFPSLPSRQWQQQSDQLAVAPV